MTRARQRSLILLAALALISPARAWAQGEPLGPEFRVKQIVPVELMRFGVE